MNFEFLILDKYCKDVHLKQSDLEMIISNKAVMKKNLIKDKSFEFSLSIIELYKKLRTEKEYIISNQILRTGTSIGANIEEASGGESRKDFIHKMSIASKEARETKYWLRLLNVSKLSNISVDEHLNEIDEIVRILTSIVKTATKNIQN